MGIGSASVLWNETFGSCNRVQDPILAKDCLADECHWNVGEKQVTAAYLSPVTEDLWPSKLALHR